MEEARTHKRSHSPSHQDLSDYRAANRCLSDRLMKQRIAALTLIRDKLQQKVRTVEQEDKQPEQGDGC